MKTVILRRVVIYDEVPCGPNGRPLCLQCGKEIPWEGWNRWHRWTMCSDLCRLNHERAQRPPRRRWLPCRVCGTPWVKCKHRGGQQPRA